MKAKDLNKEWGVKAKHALYRETGDWFHPLKKFPGAFFDKNGFILFETEAEYRNCPYLQIQQDVHVPEKISSIPGYVRVHLKDSDYTLQPCQITSILENETFYEGNQSDFKTTKYERNLKARMKCIEHYGARCSICDIDFSQEYGDFAKGIIHVHHVVPISMIGKKYIVDPIKDLIPVCPNCHAVIHRKKDPFTIQEVKEMRNIKKKQS